MKEQKWIHEGLITESLPNGMFRVRLDNEDIILGYVSGKIRRSFIRILPGDRVKIEVSRYEARPGVGVIYSGLESRVVPRPGTKGPPSCPHAGSVPVGITARY